ncbi:hypothetical protein LSH36_204g06013 [Paralvinella palmiformis]|uniref:Prospero domain-containing protein n=1 Tax=Paralvinella palmiformis TaxID=53620 RepID=A0AAD9JP52_9ANNE|nr:hypothetical protein LSH36_204g06013 [Paralvinella palmiformis]
MDTSTTTSTPKRGADETNGRNLDSPIADEVGDKTPPEIYGSSRRSPTPPPASDSLSNLHRVTDMLKDKLNSGSDFNRATSASTLDLSIDNKKSPYIKPVNGCTTTSYQAGNNKMDPFSMAAAAAAVASQQHMSMILTNELYNNESNVLRGILQGKERMFDCDGKLHPGKRFSDLYKSHVDGGDQSRGDTGDSGDSFRSTSPGNASFDSDPECGVNDDVSDPEENKESSLREADDGYLDDERDDVSSPQADVDSDGCDLKRSRVENIVNAMKNSPEGLITPPERRPKRKQYIPQQHGSLEPSHKVRKLEKEILQKQLKQMQHQLSVMQQRYGELFDQGELSDTSDLEMSPDCPEGARMMSGGERQKTKMAGTFSQLDFDASHLIKEASQLVHEQEFFTKHGVSPSGQLVVGKSFSDIDSLAKVLKAEITHRVGSLVDAVVAQFVQKQPKHSNTPRRSPSPATPVVKSKKESSSSPAVEPPALKSKSPTPSVVQNNNNNNNHNNNNNNNVVKDNITMAGASKYPPHSHLSSHQREDICSSKPPRTKVTDKITHPFFDFHHKPFGDFMRAHPALFPPPPYFPPQIPPIQPLYAKEPEQTEALALVVGTPTKKKRTKVTDTRLSPRAARALLHENMPHGGGGGGGPFDGTPKHGHHLGHPSEAYGHPPLIPISLPTSVAIPNPSLQHSDILAMYSNNGDVNSTFNDSARRVHSPSSSPNMTHTPMEALHHQLKAECESYDHLMQESYGFDGSMAIISFFFF